MVLLLSVAGGGVDGIMILAFNVLTGAQTGNTVLLAAALAQGRFAPGFYSAISVATFVVGSVAGQLAMIKGRSKSALSPIAWALLAELIPLGALLLSWHFTGHTPGPKMTPVLVGLAAVSMGIQSAAVLHLHGTPTTTYVTGTLTTFSTELSRWLFARRKGLHTVPSQGHTRPFTPPSSKRPVLYGVDWVVYLCGGVAGGLLFLQIAEIALVLPILVILAVILAGRASQYDE